MKVLLSTFYSDDDSRTALVYKVETGYEVVAFDTPRGWEKTVQFNDRLSAEDYAEDWVL